MIGDTDYSWMDEVTIRPPLPYRMRQSRFRYVFLSLCVVAAGIGALIAALHLRG